MRTLVETRMDAPRGGVCVRSARALAVAAVLCGLLVVATGCASLQGDPHSGVREAQSRQLEQQAQEIEALRGQVATLQGQLARTIGFLKKKFAPKPPPEKETASAFLSASPLACMSFRSWMTFCTGVTPARSSYAGRSAKSSAVIILRRRFSGKAHSEPKQKGVARASNNES